MRATPLKSWLTRTAILACVLWCAFALRTDLAQLSFSPLLRSWNLLLLAVLLSLLNYALRILRWRFYLGRLGHDVSRRFAALTYTAGFAFTLSPGKVGELARARYYWSLAIPTAQVAAAFFVERLSDLLAMLLLATLIIASVSPYQSAVTAAVLLIGVAVCLLSLVPWIRLATALESRPHLPLPVHGVIRAAAHALAASRQLMRPGPLLCGFLIGLLAWTLEGAELGILGSLAPGMHLAMSSAVGIYAVAMLAGALSFLPGGLGGTEPVMAALLVTRGYSLAQAVLVTLACRLATLWLAVALGWAAVWALRREAPAPEPSWP